MARAALAAFYAHRTAQVLRVPIVQLLPFGIVGRVLLVSSGAALSSAPVWFLHWSRFPTLVLGGIIFGGVYLLLGSQTRVIGREDWSMARDWIRTLLRRPRNPSLPRDE